MTDESTFISLPGLDRQVMQITNQNVGSRDWMPGWAMGMRLDGVRPSFDVYSFGKVLRAMIAGRTKMRPPGRTTEKGALC